MVVCCGCLFGQIFLPIRCRLGALGQTSFDPRPSSARTQPDRLFSGRSAGAGADASSPGGRAFSPNSSVSFRDFSCRLLVSRRHVSGSDSSQGNLSPPGEGFARRRCGHAVELEQSSRLESRDPIFGRAFPLPCAFGRTEVTDLSGRSGSTFTLSFMCGKQRARDSFGCGDPGALEVCNQLTEIDSECATPSLALPAGLAILHALGINDIKNLPRLAGSGAVWGRGNRLFRCLLFLTHPEFTRYSYTVLASAKHNQLRAQGVGVTFPSGTIPSANFRAGNGRERSRIPRPKTSPLARLSSGAAIAIRARCERRFPDSGVGSGVLISE